MIGIQFILVFKKNETVTSEKEFLTLDNLLNNCDNTTSVVGRLISVEENNKTQITQQTSGEIIEKKVDELGQKMLLY